MSWNKLENFVILNFNLSEKMEEHLVKHGKVSKYYESDCLENCPLLFILLVATQSVKNSDI